MAEGKKPDWVTIKSVELEKIVIELAKQGNTPAKIGIILRDKHGVPKAKLLGKKISKILEDNKIKTKSHKEQTIEKIKNLEEHRKTHIHDYTAARSLTKKLWVVNKIERLEKA